MSTKLSHTEGRVNEMATKLVKKDTSDRKGALGRNLKSLDGWRQRLVAATGNKTYRQVAEKAIGYDGRPMSHTTVRAVFIGPGGTNVETLAAICDAIGVNVSDILGGASVVKALPPPGGGVPLNTRVAIIPVLPVTDAHTWKDVAKNPAEYDELFYTDAEDAEGLMAARVTDVSMDPDYKPGDIVTFRDAKPQKGDHVLVRIEGQNSTALRRWNPKTNGKIGLAASNDDFGEQILAAERVNVVGVVTGFARTV